MLTLYPRTTVRTTRTVNGTFPVTDKYAENKI